MKKSIFKALLLSLIISGTYMPAYAQNDSAKAAKILNESQPGSEEIKKQLNYEIDDVFLSLYPAIDQPVRLEKSFLVEYGKALQIKLRLGKEPLLPPESEAVLEKIKVVVSCGSCINPANGTLKFSVKEQRSSEEIIVFDITSRNKISQLSEEPIFLTFYQKNRQIKKIAINITILQEEKKK